MCSNFCIKTTQAGAAEIVTDYESKMRHVYLVPQLTMMVCLVILSDVLEIQAAHTA